VLIEREHVNPPAQHHRKLGLGEMSMGPEIRIVIRDDDEPLHHVGGRLVNIVVSPRPRTRSGPLCQLVQETVRK
jgi:hypothetical protein